MQYLSAFGAAESGSIIICKSIFCIQLCQNFSKMPAVVSLLPWAPLEMSCFHSTFVDDSAFSPQI